MKTYTFNAPNTANMDSQFNQFIIDNNIQTSNIKSVKFNGFVVLNALNFTMQITYIGN